MVVWMPPDLLCKQVPVTGDTLLNTITDLNEAIDTTPVWRFFTRRRLFVQLDVIEAIYTNVVQSTDPS